MKHVVHYFYPGPTKLFELHNGMFQGESGHDVNGSRRCHAGDIIRIRGDAYLVDCNVTGFDDGASNNQLLSLFRDQQVFLNVVELDAPAGGGTTVQWQEHVCPSRRQHAYICDKLFPIKRTIKVGASGTADAAYQ